VRKTIAERIFHIRYAIRELVPLAKQLEARGEKIIYLNIGDPLKYDFDTPGHIKEALHKAVLEKHNYYSLSQGDPELREAIAYKEKTWHGVEIDPSDIVVTQGVSEAIGFVCAVLLNPGDELLVPEPSYPLYNVYPQLYGAKSVVYQCSEENDWQPDIDDIREKITGKTKGIVIINPNNPTGALYEEKTVKEILDVAAEHSLVVISDEIYDGIVFEGTFKSTASLTKDTPVIVLNGFSKTFLMTGWRLGYLYIRDPTEKYREDLLQAFIKMARCRLCAATPIQKAAVAALRGPLDHLTEMIKKLKERRDYVFKRIKENSYLSSVKPKSAFYIFPRIDVQGTWKNDRDFAEKLLLEEKVLIVHGSGFGKVGKNHFRAVFLPPTPILEEAFNRIEAFIKKHKKQ